MKMIGNKQIQLNLLCDVIKAPQSNELQNNIIKRLEELKYFENYVLKLKYFLHHIGNKLIGKNDMHAWCNNKCTR